MHGSGPAEMDGWRVSDALLNPAASWSRTMRMRATLAVSASEKIVSLSLGHK